MRSSGAALVVATVLASCGSPTTHLDNGAATVVEVVDGDTIVARFGSRSETVRLIGIDTPETVHPDRPVECFGPEATAFITELIPPGTSIRIRRDVVARDHFDRLLGYVYRASDGMFVNDEIVRHGYGTTLSIAPNEAFSAVFVASAIDAKRADLGVWTACADQR
ncbi:MAG: thermonuclease family protein [Actinomycetota bacterium]